MIESGNLSCMMGVVGGGTNIFAISIHKANSRNGDQGDQMSLLENLQTHFCQIKT
jgi:hypothetical protein